MKKNSSNKSRILLLNLGLDTDKKAIKDLTAKDLLSIFSQTGDLKRILLFTKSVLLKAFLEYPSFEDAERTLNTFHDTVMGQYGKTRLYFSPLQKIDLSNKYLEFWEEGQEQENGKVGIERRTTDCLSYNEQLCWGSDKRVLKKQSLGFLESSIIFDTETQSEFHPSELSLNFNENSSGIYKTKLGPKDLKFRNSKNTLNFNEKSSRIYSVPESKKENGFMAVKKQVKNKYSNYNNLNKNNKFMAKKNDFVRTSKVVIVSNLGYVFSGSNEIFNLFSCFGIVKSILFMKNVQKVLIEYTSMRSAAECITNIDGLQLGPTRLNLAYSKHKQIDLTKKMSPQVMLCNEIIRVPDHMQRYECNKMITSSPISPTVLIMGKWSDDLKPTDIYYFIENYCKPKSVKLANTENQKHLIQLQFTFEDVYSAIYVIYKCHRQLVKDSMIFISFYH
jgi:hypothetical protein